jgi:hypothetical protein
VAMPYPSGRPGPYPLPPSQPPHLGPRYGHPRAQPPAGAIALTSSCPLLAFPWGLFYWMARPEMVVDGRGPVRAAWGRTVFPMPPGQHHLQVFAHFRNTPAGRVGQAQTVVPVHPGQTVEVDYRVPWMMFLSGRVGPPPQQSAGLGFTLMVWAIIAAVCAFGVYARIFLE